ncbi:MAG: mechanosensitive ion channel [Deltaproteobacteria bacterium]|nr:mechanosensitive ion channel [Deltaproteobacteria bacterium]
MENIVGKLSEWFAFYGLKVVAAVLILMVGRWAAGTVKKVVNKIMTKRNLDPIIKSFVGHLVYIALIAFVILAALGQLGIQTTSFIAVIGAAGLAIGLALQGSLANFAAGFLMILFRPFKAGDFIEGAGVAGTVEEIQVFNTLLKTPDNKRIIVPNAKLTGDNIINYSSKETRRVDFVFGVGYDDDLQNVKRVLSELVGADQRILTDPAPTIGVMELADSSVNLAVRVWVNASDYWNVFFDMMEKVKIRFDSEGISIPYPQQDVHIHNGAAGVGTEAYTKAI